MLTELINKIKLSLRGELSISKLKKLGLQIGDNYSIQGRCILDPSHCWLIKIGDNVTLAPNVHIIAHDASTKRRLNYTKIGLVEVGNDVFIGAGSIVLPNVKIGDNVIIGAGSVVTRDIPANSVVAGNPARVLGNIDDYMAKNRKMLGTSPIYDMKWTVTGHINQTLKARMVTELKTGIGYVE
jgi:maltose O-acetyltransferase